MEKIMIINGSPRAPKSNSAKYADIFSKYAKGQTEYYHITKTNHREICAKIGEYADLLFVFPLYADAIPVTMLNFLKTLEQYPVQHKPTVSVLINCGFLEYEQNDIAVRMMKLFCSRNGYDWGSVLRIGSGEAILDSLFRILVTKQIKKLSKSICRKEYASFQTTMPLPKSIFLKASTKYWIEYGKKNGISEKEMQSMKIE